MTVFDPTLYLVIDPDHCSACSPEEIAFQAIQGGVTLLQLRSKTASTRDLVALAEKLQAIAVQLKVPLLINDRVDVALTIGAAGVHLGQSDLPPEHARRILGDNALIGFSISTLAQAQAAQALPIDYLGVGPVFPTQSKGDCAALSSLDGLRKICEFTCHPVIAIGGIQFHNTKAVRKAGATGIAVISAICGQTDPRSAALQLKEIFVS